MRCSRPSRAVLAMLATGCALTACGSAYKQVRSAGNPGTTPAIADQAGYHAALTRAIAALSRDTRQYFTACARPLSVSRCEQWVSSDEQLIGRHVLEPIARAQVPAALARADKRLHQIINQIYAADIALARTIAADTGNSRVQFRPRSGGSARRQSTSKTCSTSSTRG